MGRSVQRKACPSRHLPPGLLPAVLSAALPARVPARMLGRQRGVGLVEVLVAVLVLAVGFLAAGRMQVTALRNNQNAYHDSQAQLLLDDMVDRMRANRAGVRDGAYDNVSTTDATSTNCTSSGCNAAALAAYDLYQWSLSLDPVTTGALPRLPMGAAGEAGAGETPAVGTISAPDDGAYTLTLTWQDLVDGENAERTATAVFVP